MSVAESATPGNDLEKIFLAVPDVLCIFGFDGRFSLANPACSAILGVSSSELRNRFYMDFVHPDDLKPCGLALRRLAEGERNVMWHCRYSRQDRTYRKLQWHATADLNRRQIYAIARDVTELHVNEELLRDSDLKAFGTLEHTHEGILRTLSSGQVIMANPAAVQMLGYDSAADLIGQVSYLEHNLFVDPDDREILKEHLAREGTVSFECQFFRKDGTAIWVDLKARAVREENGALAYYEKFLRDISEERKLEGAVRAAEEKYRSLIENAPFGIYRIGLDGRFLDVNHAFAAMLGYESREEVIRLNIEADVYCEPEVRTALTKQFGNVERVEGVIADWRRKDGSPMTVRLSGRKVRDAFGILEGFEVIAEDLHARVGSTTAEYRHS